MPIPFLDPVQSLRIWVMLLTWVLAERCLRGSERAHGALRTGGYAAAWGLMLTGTHYALLLVLGVFRVPGLGIPDLLIPGVEPGVSLRLYVIALGSLAAVAHAVNARRSGGRGATTSGLVAVLAAAFVLSATLHQASDCLAAPQITPRGDGLIAGMALIAEAWVIALGRRGRRRARPECTPDGSRSAAPGSLGGDG